MEANPTTNPAGDESGITPLEAGQIPPIFVTVDQAARILGGTSPWTVYELIKAGEVKAQRRGRKLLVVVESLREYAANLPAVPTAKDAS